jgi:hypothetical protein
MCRCFLRVLCPVSRPVTALDWVLLNNNRQALVARPGQEINSRACLWVLQGPCHVRCCIPTQCCILLLICCLETPRKAPARHNIEQNHSLQAHRQFCFLSLWHAQKPKITQQHAVQRYCSTPAGAVVHLNAGFCKRVEVTCVADLSEQSAASVFRVKLDSFSESSTPPKSRINFVWPCIIETNNIENQLDATLMVY